MSAPPPKKTGLSLYANLLNPERQSQGATISGAPVKYDVKKESEEEAARKKDASLKFQPIKRPQVQQKNNKPKIPPSSSSNHKFSSSTATLSASSPDNKQLQTSTPQHPPGVQRSNFEDWIGDDEDEYYYQERPRGAKRNKKKNKKNQREEHPRSLDWDSIYDPTQPNVYAEYKGSEEKLREHRDWKARLYYHMRDAKRQGSNGVVDSDDYEEQARPMKRMFAPPSNVAFAPPSFDDSAPPPPDIYDDDAYEPTTERARQWSDSYEPPAASVPALTPNNAIGEDAYLHRTRMSGATQDRPTPPPPPPPAAVPQKPDEDLDKKRAEAQAKIAAFKAKLQQKALDRNAAPAAVPPPPPPPAPAPSDNAAEVSVPQHALSPPPPPPDESAATISRAPVRYEQPPPPSNTSANEEAISSDAMNENQIPEADEVRTKKPGQKGFAERLLKKYGWEKGQGLGAQGEGITTALIGKADKRKKLADSQGGGWAQPANMGKIVGGKRRKTESTDTSSQINDDARFGQMSQVIKLRGMLDGLDVQKEIEQNNLMQEIGDEMGGQHGNVERVFIWREAMGGSNEVFVKFTSQLSALRAVNGMDGVTFAGNEVGAGFWDGEMFERGEYA